MDSLLSFRQHTGYLPNSSRTTANMSGATTASTYVDTRNYLSYISPRLTDRTPGGYHSSPLDLISSRFHPGVRFGLAFLRAFLALLACVLPVHYHAVSDTCFHITIIKSINLPLATKSLRSVGNYLSETIPS